MNKKSEWSNVHQKFELDFHKKNNFRWDDEKFIAQFEKLFGEFMNFKLNSFNKENVILDIGCGSRPAFDWFKNLECKKYHLDPLLNSFTDIPQVKDYWVNKDKSFLISVPAEKKVDFLVNKCDFINCWNVLDHSYNWEKILKNIIKYCKKGSKVCLGTDFESHGSGHPGIPNKDYFYSLINKYFTIIKKKKNFIHREIALNLTRNDIDFIEKNEN